MEDLAKQWVKDNCRFASATVQWINDNCKFAAAGPTAEIQGPAVDWIINTFGMMLGRGAPIEFDDMGFNKNDYSSSYTQEIAGMSPGSKMPVRLAIWAVDTLQKYKNRQFPQWAELKQQVQQAIQAATPATEAAPAAAPAGEKTVRLIGKGEYGKTTYFIPEIGTPRNPITTAIKAVVRQKMTELSEKGDRRYQQVTGDYGTDYPIYRAFSKSRAGFDQYDIHPEFAGIIADVLKQKGFNVDAMAPAAPAAPAAAPAPAAPGAAPAAPAASVSQGRPLGATPIAGDGVRLKFQYDPDMMAKVKAVQGRRTWNGAEKAWDVWTNPADLRKLSDEFKVAGYDVSQLESMLKVEAPKDDQKGVAAPPPVQRGYPLEASDISMTGKFQFQVAVRSTRDKEKNVLLKEATRYTFPTYGLDGMRNYDKNGYMWQLNGTHSQYEYFMQALEVEKFDTSGIRRVVDALVAKGAVKEDKVPGVLDGYQKDGKNDPEGFDQDTDKTVKVNLYDKQKEGVRFLYSRRSAIIGDETGAGKTWTTVAAAAMRLKQTGGRALIITLPSTLVQWMKEIIKATGDTGQVSTDPNEGKKWTVLYYHMFNNSNVDKADPMGRKRRDKLTADILAQKFTCLILDECHNVKNENITTENIAQIAEKIPFKWGASATIIANKAIDAYNQLRILDHPLGHMSLGRFKQEFAGMVPEGYGGAYIAGSKEQQAEAATQLRKWLAKTGAYIKRTKRDINPNMPNHSVEDVPINIDAAEFEKRVNKRMAQYKTGPEGDPLAISQMIAERTEVATMKVPTTLDLAKNVLMQGKKTLVFTCFIESANALKAGLDKIVASPDVGGGAVEMVVGNMDKEQTAAAVERFKADPECKALVLSILKGGTGIDLPNVVSDVFINDFSWTPKDAEQSEGRAFRISSTSDVTTKYVVADNSSDRKMYTYVQDKKEIARLIQNLEKEEHELVMKGMSTDAIKQKRAELEARDRAAEALRMQRGPMPGPTPPNPIK